MFDFLFFPGQRWHRSLRSHHLHDNRRGFNRCALSDRRVRAMSHGERRRLFLVVACTGRPSGSEYRHHLLLWAGELWDLPPSVHTSEKWSMIILHFSLHFTTIEMQPFIHPAFLHGSNSIYAAQPKGFTDLFIKKEVMQ